MTLGALLGDTPHSRPIRCTGSATDEVLAARLGMERSRYEGPTGIVGVLHDAVRRLGFASASIWAPVPHYVAIAAQPEGDARHPRQARRAPRPGARSHRSRHRVEPRGNARSHDVVAGDAEVTGYVDRLEARYDESLTGVDRPTTRTTTKTTTTTGSTRTTSRRATPSPKTSSATSASTARTKRFELIVADARSRSAGSLSRGGRGRGRPRAGWRARGTRRRRVRRCRGTSTRSRRTRGAG